MREKSWFREYGLILAAGVAVGIAALILTASGNPKNMGFCIACFLRDIAGALGLHSAANVQYIRSEIIGIVVGAAAAALAAREFRAKAGASPACRFVLGMFVMIGALVFLGCPLRMVIRLGGGDLTAVAGLVGFIAGILVGVVCLKKGFSLGRAYPVRMGEGFVLSGILMALLGLLLLVPTLLKFSEAGPGSMRAFWGISLAAGLVVGVLAQRSRLCMAGGIRDAVMLRDFKLLSGFLAIWGTVTIGNLVLGSYSLSALSQPIAHSQYLWSALGMALAGWGSILLGGCPLRQLILAGEGNGDSAVTVLGMIVGAAVSHNFGLAGAADSVAEDGTYVVGGIGTAGMAAVAIGFAVLLAITVTHLPILSTWWPGAAPRSLSANTSPRAAWPWWRAGCRSAIGRTRTAASAEAPRSSPTMSTSGIPNGTAPAISAAHPLLTAPPWAAATPHRWADNPISPRSAKRTANCRSDF